MLPTALFADQLDRFGSAVALIPEAGQPISYQDIAQRADQVGNHLAPGKLAYLLAENSAASVAGYLGMLRARAPVAMLSAALPQNKLTELLAAYRPRHVWLPRSRIASLPFATEVLVQDGYALAEMPTDAPVANPELALLATTSGSTGSLKFVRQSYRNLAANAAAIAGYLEIGPTDRAITSLPMNYVFGMSVINSHLQRGASLVLTDKGLAEKGFWDLLKSSEATSFGGVPYTYQMLRQLRFGRMTLPHLKTLVQAGGKLAPELVKEFALICREKSIKFYVMYGAAEATARMSYLPPELAVEKPDSIGIPIPGGAFSLIDENGDAIDADGVAGELVYRGENVSLGYAAGRDDLARGDDNNGVLRTGDIARRDADGFYDIIGRKSRFIKIFGNRVNLADVELHLGKLDIECACAGEDDKLHIFGTRDSDGARAIAAVQELTGLHSSAFVFVAIDKIPRNESGKVLYSQLADACGEKV
jgi:long-chain acyl-CoA synthetase